MLYILISMMILADNHSINECAKNLCPNPTKKTLGYENLIIKTHWHIYS